MADPTELGDLPAADLLEEVDADDLTLRESMRRVALKTALSVAEDVADGMPGRCSCTRKRCAGPAQHWTPLEMIPEVSPNGKPLPVDVLADNHRRRSDNVSRLETLVFVVHTLRELEDPPADPVVLEAWAREQWRCEPFPDHAMERAAWAFEQCRRLGV